MPERATYDLLPADTYEVTIEKLEDKEQDVYGKPGEKETAIQFTFRIVEEGEYKDRLVWKRARPVMFAGSSQGSPSTLYSIFCAANAISLLQEDANGVGAENLNGLEGKYLRIVVTQKQKKDGATRNDVESFLPTKANKGKEARRPKAAAELKDEDIPVVEEGSGNVDPGDIPF